LVIQTAPKQEPAHTTTTQQLIQQNSLSGSTLPGIIPLDPGVCVALSGAPTLVQESFPQGGLSHGYSLDQETVPGYPQYQVVMPVHAQDIINHQQLQQPYHGDQVGASDHQLHGDQQKYQQQFLGEHMAMNDQQSQQQYPPDQVINGDQGQLHGDQVMVTEPDGLQVGDMSGTGQSNTSATAQSIRSGELGDTSSITTTTMGGHSVKSMEEIMSDPPRQSTPVASPERPLVQETSNKLSRFAVQKVEETPAAVEPELAGPGSLARQYSRSCSISADGRISAEAEHYDSSPSPGSCYDTASESVEPSMLQMYGDQVMYNGPVQATRTEGFHGMQPPVSAQQEPRRPSHSWPATWPDSTRPVVSLADTSAQVPKSLVGGGAPAEDHHTSGDSIPVGCEASHLDISGDSGLGSLIRGPLLQQGNLPPSTSAGQEQFRQPQVQENFCPGPESTFMPVEPAKEPTLDVESVEDDHNEITEEESFIQNALNRLDQRHAAEMEILQRRMEELQRHYMKEKENLRVDLVSTLFSARKMVHQQQEMAAMAQAGVQEVEDANASPQLIQLQQQKQMIQQQINEHMRQQQQVQQHQQNFQQLQSTGQRDVQQQQLLQQQLQQQLNSLMFSPPPGHTSRNSQGGVPTTSPQQVLQPVPARYAYMPTGTQPQFVTINGQQLQVVGGLQGQQLVAVQGGPGQPQQYFSLPPDQIQQLSIPRPQSFVPARFSPRPVEQEGREKDGGAGGGEEEHRIIERLDASSVMSEPSRPVVMEQHKRDSFSDSGAEGSGHNTPTRGRTITEGLLRYVQDSSVARPPQRYSNVENPVGHASLQNNPLQNQTQAFQTQKPVSNFGFQTPQPQNPGFQPQTMHPLTQTQIPSNYVLQNPPQNLAGSIVSIPPGVAQTVGVVQPQPQPVVQRQTGRDSVPLATGRESVPLVREGVPLTGRDSVPTGMAPLVRDTAGPLTGRDSVGLAPLSIPPGEQQACHVPVIQAVAEQPQALPYPSVIQQNYLPGPSYPTSIHGYNPYQQHTRGYTQPFTGYSPNKPLGSAPPYTGPAPGFSSIPGAVYNQFASANPLQTFPPGPMCSTPGSVGGYYQPPQDPNNVPSYGSTVPSGYQVVSPPPSSSFQPVSSTQNSTGEVTTIRQPIMSSTAQPGYSSVSGMIPVMMMPPSCVPNAVYRLPAQSSAIPPSPLSPPGQEQRIQQPHLPPPVPHGSIGHNSFQPAQHINLGSHSQPSLHQIQNMHGVQQNFPSNQSMSGSFHENQGGGVAAAVQQEEHQDVPEKPT